MALYEESFCQNTCTQLHTNELHLNNQMLPNTQGSKQKIYKYYSLEKGFDRKSYQCSTQLLQMKFWAAGSTEVSTVTSKICILSSLFFVVKKPLLLGVLWNKKIKFAHIQ